MTPIRSSPAARAWHWLTGMGRGPTLRAHEAAATPEQRQQGQRQLPPGLITLTIGITGHRSIDLADYPLYEQRIHAFFDQLEAAYPYTPLRVLSALAEGADRLPTEVALARGYQVFVPVPLPVAEYEEDFPETLDEFRGILARIPPENVFELPQLGSRPPGSTMSPEALRDLHYAQVGAYIASHCHILLAMWDGVTNDLRGGTSDVVHYKLEGSRPYGLAAPEALELPDTGPVVHLHTRRSGNPVDTSTAIGELRWLYPEGRSEDEFAYIYKSIDNFNGDPARAAALASIDTGKAFEGLPAALRREQRELIDVFCAADALAIHYQRISTKVLKVMVTLGGIMAILYEAYSHLAHPRVALGGYLTAFILVCIIYGWQRKANTHQHHLDYRALAEGMRVQLFWTVAGVQQSVAGSYLRKQNDELQWIREALRPVKVRAHFALASPAFLHQVWILDQMGYFSRSAGRLRKTVRQVELVSMGLFAIGLVRTAAMFLTWDMLEETHMIHHWSIVSIGSAPIVGALMEAYSERMGNEARSKQHAILAGTFSRAESAFRRLQEREPDNIAALQALLAALGREALIENGDWVLLRRERPMVLPKG